MRNSTPALQHYNMKTTFTLVFAFACILTATAQIGGYLDPSFAGSGRVIRSLPGNSGNIARGVALLGDGSLLVVGETNSTVTGKDFFVSKFSTSGVLDNTFGTGGTVTTDLQLGSDDAAYSIVVDANNNFILAGNSSDGTKQSAALVRYQPNGRLDSTFGTNGIVITNCISGNADNFRKVKIHTLTGKILAAGNSVYNNNYATAVIARYNTNGTLDTGFDTTGINVFPTLGSNYTELRDLYVAPSGKVTAVGNTTHIGSAVPFDGWLTRLNANGTPDVTFGTGGAMVEDYHTYNNAMYIEPGTGNIYTAGSEIAYFGESNYNERLSVKRATANGQDDNWAYAGSNIYYFTSPGGAPAYANAMVVTPDGYFITAGAAYTNTERAGLLMKLEPDGSRDVTFGISGGYAQITETFNTTNLTEMNDMVLQPDGKIVVVGYTGSAMFIARYFGSTVPRLSSFNLSSPANNTNNVICTDVTFDWTDAPGATGYEIEIDSNPNFSNPDTSYSGISYLESYMVSGVRNSGTTYYWRVRAYNNDSVGAWVGPRQFTTAVDNITLITPANGAINVATSSVFFDWSDVPLSANSIDVYNIEYATNPGFNNAVSVPFFSGISDYTQPNLDANTTYYWRVRVAHGAVCYGPWGSAQFTTGGPSGINDGKVLSGVSVYPNPATDLLLIKGLQPTDVAVAKIYDAAGRLMHGGLVNNKVNVSELPAGAYTLLLSTESASGSFGFIKQ